MPEGKKRVETERGGRVPEGREREETGGREGGRLTNTRTFTEQHA